MFVHTCTACAKRQLIFPSQFTGVSGQPGAVVATFTCWCGAEQSSPLDWAPRAAAEPRPRRLSEPARAGDARRFRDRTGTSLYFSGLPGVAPRCQGRTPP